MAGHPVGGDEPPNEATRLLTGEGGSGERQDLIQHGPRYAAIAIPSTPPAYGESDVPDSPVAAHVRHGAQPDYTLRYDDPEDAERAIDVRVPAEWLRGLSEADAALVDNVLRRPPDERRGLQLQGHAGDGWRLSYVLPIVLDARANANCRVQVLVFTEPDGTQRLERLTLTRHAPDGRVAAQVSLPPLPTHFRCAALDVEARNAPGGGNAPLLSLPLLGVHVVGTSDQRHPVLVPMEDGGCLITFVTAHPFAPFDLHVSIRTAVLRGVERVVAVGHQGLPVATQDWLVARDEPGAPGLPREVADMLLVALLDPFEVEAEVGLSRTHRDRYVAFNRTFNCTTDGTFSPEPQGWQVRADFHLNENVWELGVVQCLPPDRVRRTVYAPNRGDFVNMRRPRDGSHLGSPPSSSARTEVSTSSRRAREVEQPDGDRRATARVRVLSPARSLQEEASDLGVTVPASSQAGNAPPPAQTPGWDFLLASPVVGGLITQDEYRTAHARLEGNAYAQAGVCGAIAAGVVLGRVISFDRVRAVAADPVGGMTLAENRTLLANEGATTESVQYPPGLGWTVGLLGNDLQSRLDGGGFDRAVICFRVDEVREHYVAIWQQGGRWLLHDGIGQPGVRMLPQGAEGAWMAHHLFGRPQQALHWGREMGLLLANSNNVGDTAGGAGGSSGPAPPGGGVPTFEEVLGEEALRGSPAPQRPPTAFTARLEERDFEGLRPWYECTGVFAAWTTENTFGPVSRMRVELAHAVYPERDSGQRIGLGEPIYRYDRIPFAGLQVSVLVRYTDESRSEVHNLLPVSTHLVPSEEQRALTALR